MWRQIIKKPKTCTVCYERKVTVKLACKHAFCEACLKTWFQTLMGPDSLTCPDCRSDVEKTEVIERFGQDFLDSLVQAQQEQQPRPDEIDELTAAYLERQDLAQCKNCGFWIEKIDGCDAIVCLCGHRFCFVCGDLEDCQCGHEAGDYYDNILEQETAAMAEREASMDELFDLREFIERYQMEAEEEAEQEGWESADNAIETEIQNQEQATSRQYFEDSFLAASCNRRHQRGVNMGHHR